MSRRKSRRAVFACVLLTGSPTQMRLRGDGVSLDIEFATIAELRAWLASAGLDTPQVLSGEHDGTFEDGRRYRSMNAYPTWHGWKIYASATEHIDTTPLDTKTRDGLTALAEVA